MVSGWIADNFPNLSVLVLDRKWSNHCPIFLRDLHLDYGSTAFKFFNSWLDIEGFEDTIRQDMTNFVVDDGWSKFVLFKNNLKFLKNRIQV